jgi:outer membrane protein assembly factor BamD
MYKRHSYIAGALLVAALLGGCASGSPYQGMSADQLFEIGAQEFQEEDWDEAVRAFERFIFAGPTNPRIVEARLYLARAYYNREDYITAASEFSRIVDRHPGDLLAPEASLGICKSYVALSPHIERDQSYTAQAFNACDNVLQDFPGHEVAVEAEQLRDQMRERLARKELTRGDFYFQRKMYNSGIIYYNGLLTLYPRTEAASEALLRLYQSYSAIGWESEAEDARERLLRDFPGSEAAEQIRANGGESGGSGSGTAQGRSP